MKFSRIKFIYGVLYFLAVGLIALYFLWQNTLQNVWGSREGFEGAAADINSFVDVVYYINLDHRTDRKEAFLKEMEKTNIAKDKIKRIAGHYMENRGHLGCSRSHIQALEEFVASSHKTCIVFEDDFQFSQPSETIASVFQQLQPIPYDVCMLSGNVLDEEATAYPFLKKVKMATTTSGYMVSKTFAPLLLENFKEGANRLKQSYDQGTKETPYKGEYAIDQFWCQLQPVSKWFVFNPKLGKQGESYSDIIKGKVKYTM
jgi:GR25 family glycosyltransferase involved in LPS biosynthesis